MTRRLLISIGCLCWLGIICASAQAPVADFSATPTSGCGPLNVTFKDLSTNNPIFWQWDFGNGQTSTQQNPSVTYAAGTYTVTLIVRNANGTNATRKTNYITAFPFPLIGFAADLRLACAPANIQFTDQSTPGQGTITAWTWDLGDGTTSHQQNPSHVYTQTGYYTIGLTATNSQGCSNAAASRNYLRVVPGIQPDFAYNQVSTSCSAPFILNFINQTAGPGKLTFNWDLSGANPNSSSDTSPAAISYPNGNFTVNLTVFSDLGCTANIKKPLSFAGGNAVINGPDTACINTAVSFSNGSTPAPLSSLWDFGDGTGSAIQSPSKTYTAVAPYTVKLVNTYSTCKDSATKLIQVINNPTPAFTADHTVSCKAPFTVQFTDQTAAPIPAKWLWDFGDGSTSTSQNPSHQYNNTGQYDVKLTVTNSAGCSNTLTKTQYIQIVAPTVSIDGGDGSLQGCVSPSTITPRLHINAVDGVSSYLWTVPDATPTSSTLPNPSFGFTAQGSYPVTVLITTNGGCTATATGTAVIGTPSATPDFTITPLPVCGTNAVNFQSTSTPADHWNWSFGDGTFYGDDKDHLSHSYTDLGTYLVSLTSYNHGCSSYTAHNVTVTGAIVGFTHKSVCPDPFTIQFTDTSHINPLIPAPTWLWDFGDAINNPGTNTSTLQNPTHIYNNTGTTPTPYNVTLTITTATCVNTVTIPITVGPTTVSFTSPANACRNTDFPLTSTSTNPSLIAGYFWQIDGNPATAPVPPSTAASYTGNIPTFGLHTLTLTITDVNGCTSTANNPITITGPTAKFSAPAGGCKNSPIAFTDQSTGYPGSAVPPPPAPAAPISNWHLDFGDGNSQDFTTPPYSHTYADTNSYIVKLTVTDNVGCTDTASHPVQITSPQAFFSGPDSFYCPKTLLTFMDSSQGHGLTDTWDFGDGSTSNAPSHTYPTSGQTYTVTLTVKDQVGCTSSVSHPVRIQQPIAAFTIADTTAICTPLQTLFTAQGQFYDSLYWDFGDGTTSTLPNTSHFYNDYGTYTAKLFLQGPGGCLDSASRLVYVSNPFSNYGYTGGPLIQKCDSLLVDFKIIVPDYTHFYFIFGDGTNDSSGNTNLSHLYRRPYIYTTQLVMNDASGCIVGVGSNTGTITILGAVPYFSMDKHKFCDSGTVAFTDYTIPVTDAIASETYNFGDGNSATQSTPGNFNAIHLYNIIGPQFPTLTVTTNNGCVESYSDTIRVYRTPHPLISTTGLLCTGLIQFEGNLTTPDTDTVNWAWNFGNGQSSKQQNPAENFAAGTYNVNLKTSIPFGCADTISKAVTINPLPVIKGPAEITTPVGIPVTLPFTYSSNVTTWSWTPTNYLNCADCSTPAASPTFDQQYKVSVTDANGCADSATILVKTICNGVNYWLPNTFSPNGDGINDIFYVRGDNLYNVQSMRIFNRWGQLVFERKNFPANVAADGWDGTFNGHPAASDAYIYIVEVICNNAQVVALHGDISLVR